MGDDRAKTGPESRDRLGLDIACIRPERQRAELVSTKGSHCRVWRSAIKTGETAEDPEGAYTEFVIKYPLHHYAGPDSGTLIRQYRELREALDELVPEALFFITCIDRQPNLVVIARAVNIWFNIANPVNREEAIGLLRDSAIAREQLEIFLRAARRWREGPNPKVIDLYGLDNLVMDNRHRIRYLDSFFVFFFEDMLHLLGGERDYELEDKITVSLKRLAYLEEILAEASE